MKTDELKSKIKFKSVDVGENLTMITGSLEVHAAARYDRREIASYSDPEEAIEQMKARLAECILRMLYDDQRRDIYAALHDLFWCNPMDFAAMSSAREKLLTAATRQQPIQ